MGKLAGNLKRIARAAWSGLREWSGDAAYERYLRRNAAATPRGRALTLAEFYVEHVNRKYSRPSRCC